MRCKGVDHERCVVDLKTGCIDAKICMSERKIMKIVIALKKNMFYIMKKTLFPEWTLSPHCMYAALLIANDGHLRRNTLVNLESAFTRLMSVWPWRTRIKSQCFKLRVEPLTFRWLVRTVTMTSSYTSDDLLLSPSLSFRRQMGEMSLNEVHITAVLT